MGFTSHRGFESRPLRSPPRRATTSVWPLSSEAHAPVAQLDRASVYGTEGHRFESCRARSRIWLSEGKSGRLSNPWGGNNAGNKATVTVLPLERTSVPGGYRRGSRFVVVCRSDGRQRKETAATLSEARAI